VMELAEGGDLLDVMNRQRYVKEPQAGKTFVGINKQAGKTFVGTNKQAGKVLVGNNGDVGKFTGRNNQQVYNLILWLNQNSIWASTTSLRLFDSQLFCF